MGRALGQLVFPAVGLVDPADGLLVLGPVRGGPVVERPAGPGDRHLLGDDVLPDRQQGSE